MKVSRPIVIQGVIQSIIVLLTLSGFALMVVEGQQAASLALFVLAALAIMGSLLWLLRQLRLQSSHLQRQLDTLQNSPDVSHFSRDITNLLTREEQTQPTTAGLHQVNDPFERIALLVERLAQRSDEIVGIINVITDITHQTHLLALNAAIEAARTSDRGEQGRGFAGVANEVCNLTERTRVAIDEMAAMVTAICNETHEIVKQVTVGRERVQERAQQTADVLGQIILPAEEAGRHTPAMIAAKPEQYATTLQQITHTAATTQTDLQHSNSAIHNLLRLAVDIMVTAHAHTTLEQSDLHQILDSITQIRMNTILLTSSATIAETAEPIIRINALDRQITRCWNRHLDTPLSTEERQLAAAFDMAWSIFKEACTITLTRSAAGDFKVARYNTIHNAGPKFQTAKACLLRCIQQSHR